MPRLSRAEYLERMRDVRLLVLDVDGVLTSGEIIFIDDDREAKAFCVHDGSAVFIARLIGVEIAVITARASKAVERRFNELPVAYLRQGEKDKVSACRAIQEVGGFADHEVAFVGDDLIDLPLLEHVGVGITVPNGHMKLRDLVDWVTDKRGGEGAAREVVDDLVTAKDLWDDVLEDYRSRQGTRPDNVTQESGS